MTSGMPSSSSSLRKPAERVGCETWQAAAARAKCRSRATATRYIIWRTNMLVPVFEAAGPKLGAPKRTYRNLELCGYGGHTFAGGIP
jgi:hypothetical protein